MCFEILLDCKTDSTYEGVTQSPIISRFGQLRLFRVKKENNEHEPGWCYTSFKSVLQSNDELRLWDDDFFAKKFWNLQKMVFFQNLTLKQNSLKPRSSLLSQHLLMRHCEWRIRFAYRAIPKGKLVSTRSFIAWL